MLLPLKSEALHRPAAQLLAKATIQVMTRPERDFRIPRPITHIYDQFYSMVSYYHY